MSLETKQINEVEHVEQLAFNLDELDLDNLQKERFGGFYSFKKGAPRELVEEHKDYWNKGYVARITHPQATYLSQLIAKEYKAPIALRSVDTAMEVHNLEKDTRERVQGWEHNREALLKLQDSLWVIPNPKVVPENGKLVYDINGSIRNIVKLTRGRQTVEASEQNIDGGIKVEERKDIFRALKGAGILRDHDVRTGGGGIYFTDSDYPNLASVGSVSLGGSFRADAYSPSYRAGDGLARPELVEKK